MLTAIVGDEFAANMGNLKTYTMTLLSYLDQKNGRDIYANYKLNFPYSPITSFQDLVLELSDMNNATLAVDELSVYFDAYSRPSQKDGTKQLKNFARQTRKRSIKFYYTSQTFGDINKSLRKVTLQIFRTRKYHTDYSLCEDEHCYKKHILGITKLKPYVSGMVELSNERYFPVITKLFEVYDSDEIIEIE